MIGVRHVTVSLPVQPRYRMSGFGLIELMIAMVLGLIVVGAAFAIFQSNQSAYRASEGLSRIQESARAAFEMMSNDIRAAGASACSSASSIVTTDDDSKQFLSEPVHAVDDGIVVMSGTHASYEVTAFTSSSVTVAPKDGLSSVEDVFREDDVLLLCNPHMTLAVDVTNVDGLTVAFNPRNGGAGFQESFSKYGVETVMLARLGRTAWSVGDDVSGRPALFVSRQGGADEAVAEGVQDIGFSYLEQGAADYTDTPANWNLVIAVRIHMTLQGEDIDGSPLTRVTSNVINLRGRTL